jgi:hypothetical protein
MCTRVVLWMRRPQPSAAGPYSRGTPRGTPRGTRGYSRVLEGTRGVLRGVLEAVLQEIVEAGTRRVPEYTRVGVSGLRGVEVDGVGPAAEAVEGLKAAGLGNYVHVCTSRYICPNTHTHIYIHICIPTYICIYIYANTCMHICMYMHMYT